MALRILIAALFVLAYSTAFIIRDKENPKLKYEPDLDPVGLLSTIVIFCAIAFLFDFGRYYLYNILPSKILYIFLTVNLYYIILYFLMPLAKNYYNNRTITFLWLLPNILYFAMYINFSLGKPLTIIDISYLPIKPIIYTWLIVSLSLLTYYLTSHFAFRRQILKNSTRITEGKRFELLMKYEEEIFTKRKKFKLYTSHLIQTPLSIGLFQSTILIVLPEINYSEEELSSIYRHELIHIKHLDSQMKFFLTVMKCFCFFNPFLWKVNEDCSESIELLCDEFVVENYDENQKKAYASLVLETAGDSRGFTTCLSAKAITLKNRLNEIIAPTKKKLGIVMIAALCVLMTSTYGIVAFAYEKTTFPEMMQIEFVHDGVNFEVQYDIPDEKALRDYISNIEMYRMSGDFRYNETDPNYTLWVQLKDDHKSHLLRVYDDYITIEDSYLTSIPYYSKDKIDLTPYIQKRITN